MTTNRAPRMTGFKPLNPTLNPRETQVRDLIRLGYTNQGIAKMLCISIDSVKSYTKRLFDKMGCSSRIEIILMADVEKSDNVITRKRALRIQEVQLTHQLASVQAELAIIEEV